MTDKEKKMNDNSNIQFLPRFCAGPGTSYIIIFLSLIGAESWSLILVQN
jgi:hypothetical protein